MFLNADQILQADDRRYEEVPVPEWAPAGTNPKDAKVRLRSLTGNERDKWEDNLPRDKKGKISSDNLRASLAAEVIVNEHGEKLFAGARMITQLGNKAAAPIDRIFEAAQRMNGIKEEDVEELMEGFGEGTDEASTSD